MSLDQKPAKVRLTFLGDLMCLASQVRAMRKSSASYDDVFNDVKHLWRDSDYVMANLETPVANPKHGYSFGQMSFNAPVEFLEAVGNSGINFVSLANNHCLDCGMEGLDETVMRIHDLGIDSSGAYLTANESDRPFVKKVKGVNIAVACCTYGINGMDEAGLPEMYNWKVDTLTRGSITHRPVKYKKARVLYARFMPEWIKSARQELKHFKTGIPSVVPVADSIHPDQIGRDIDVPCIERFKNKLKLAKEQAEIVLALPHVGGQYNPAPGEYQKHTMRWILDSGVDIVVANHAHRPLRCERSADNRLAAYALGNFCFTPGVGYYLPNVLADYSVVLTVMVDAASRTIEKVIFHTTKSIVRDDGVAVVVPVYDLYCQQKTALGRETLKMENEAVVNCFRGKAEAVAVEKEYDL